MPSSGQVLTFTPAQCGDDDGVDILKFAAVMISPVRAGAISRPRPRRLLAMRLPDPVEPSRSIVLWTTLHELLVLPLRDQLVLGLLHTIPLLARGFPLRMSRALLARV